MNKNIKKRTHRILEKATKNDLASKIFDIFIITLIILNIIFVIFGTVKSFNVKYFLFFKYFEILSIIIFTIEYILRIWSCTENIRFKNPFLGRLRFIITPMAVIDLISILPFYLPMFIPLDLRILRAFRLFRLFRLFKIGRYSKAMITLGNVINKKKEELIISVLAVIILLIISSSLMYYIENAIQPDKFSSIPESMWWGVATLTTVGYGDIYPITPLGKFFGAIISLLGVGLFALPAGILASGFNEEIQKRKNFRITCPYCGKYIDNIK